MAERTTLKQIRREQAEAMQRRKEDIAHAYNELCDLEKKWGHTGVFCALKTWFNKPKKGKFL